MVEELCEDGDAFGPESAGLPDEQVFGLWSVGWVARFAAGDELTEMVSGRHPVFSSLLDRIRSYDARLRPSGSTVSDPGQP